jgi:hypothetical protein
MSIIYRAIKNATNALYKIQQLKGDKYITFQGDRKEYPQKIAEAKAAYLTKRDVKKS